MSLPSDLAAEGPERPTAKTTKTYIQSGLNYGRVGAVKRVTFALKQPYPCPSYVKAPATGGIF
jgi:pantothenate kinase type III